MGSTPLISLGAWTGPAVPSPVTPPQPVLGAAASVGAPNLRACRASLARATVTSPAPGPSVLFPPPGTVCSPRARAYPLGSKEKFLQRDLRPRLFRSILSFSAFLAVGNCRRIRCLLCLFTNTRVQPVTGQTPDVTPGTSQEFVEGRGAFGTPEQAGETGVW